MSELIIALTDRRPIKINKDNCPIIASSKDWDNQYECQANRTWKLFVRELKEKYVIYGIYTSQFQSESGKRGGEIVESLDDVPEAIKRVADYLDFTQQLADDCIANLPAEEI